MLSPDEIEKLVPAEEEKLRSPIPTRAISSDEFFPGKQTEKQKEFEKLFRLNLADQAVHVTAPAMVALQAAKKLEKLGDSGI